MNLISIAFFTIFGTLFSNSVEAGSVDLHAHLFMKQGITWLMNGDFSEDTKAKSWKSRFNSQASAHALENSGASIVVMAIYATRAATLSLKDSARLQIKRTEKFVADHPNWILAKSPSEAEHALSIGKKVLILGLEGISGIIESDADIQEFVVEKGIRVITLLHFTDDTFGGVSLLKGIFSLASPVAWLSSVSNPDFSEGVKINNFGLTAEGLSMVERLNHQNVWIDLTHSSDKSQKAIIEFYRKKDLPLLYTHTALRSYHHAERGLAKWQLKQVQQSRGLVGIMPSEQMIEGTKINPWLCPSGCECIGGISALASQYNEMALVIGSESVVMGSDVNGTILGLRPSCGTNTELDNRGYFQMSHIDSVWKGLKAVGAQVPNDPDLSARHFVKTWQRLFN